MSNYIPKIGDLFTVGSTAQIYQRCSVEDISTYFGVFVTGCSIYFMYETDRGSLSWDYFGEFSEFKPAVPKPPVCIMPLRTHNAIRLKALMDTLLRYAQESTPAKVQWVQEVSDLIEYERNNKS